MNDPQPVCPRCDQPMEKGYIVDHGHSVVYPSAWVEGVPRWGRLLGLRIKGLEKMPITSFRCASCGLLESYARRGEWRV